MVAAAALLSGLLGRAGRARSSTRGIVSTAGGWAARPPFTTEWEVAGEVIEAAVPSTTVRSGSGPAPEAARARLAGGDLVVETDANRDPVQLRPRRAGLLARTARRRLEADPAPGAHRSRRGPAGTASGRLTSPMPGTVLAVYVSAGESVHAGQALVMVEAMKMEHVVDRSPGRHRGELLVRAGEAVRLDQPSWSSPGPARSR